VLLVDDDPALLDVGRRTLSSNFPVVAVSEVGEARAALADVRIAVLLTDMELSRGNGLDLATEAAAHRPDVIRILLTGSDAVDGPRTTHGARFHRTLRKPVPPRELREVVAHAADVWLLRRRTAELRAAAAMLHDHALGPEPASTIGADESLKRAVAAFERQCIADTLVALRGNKSGAARQLGLTYRGLLLKMQRHGMLPRKHAGEAEDSSLRARGNTHEG